MNDSGSGPSDTQQTIEPNRIILSEVLHKFMSFCTKYSYVNISSDRLLASSHLILYVPMAFNSTKVKVIPIKDFESIALVDVWENPEQLFSVGDNVISSMVV
jgi:hypothetical protein